MKWFRDSSNVIYLLSIKYNYGIHNSYKIQVAINGGCILRFDSG